MHSGTLSRVNGKARMYETIWDNARRLVALSWRASRNYLLPDNRRERAYRCCVQHDSVSFCKSTAPTNITLDVFRTTSSVNYNVSVISVPVVFADDVIESMGSSHEHSTEPLHRFHNTVYKVSSPRHPINNYKWWRTHLYTATITTRFHWSGYTWPIY